MTYSPQGVAAAVRPETRLGTPITGVSLQDRLFHNFTFPGTAGTAFQVTLETQPSGQRLLVLGQELTANGTAKPTATAALPQQTVTTPFTTTLVATGDTAINFLVFDEYQAQVTISRLSVLATQQIPDTTSYRTFVTVAGDSFTGFSGAPGNAAYNDLATLTDQQRLVADLLNGVNAIWAPTGIQIDVGGSGFTRLTSAQVSALDPSLVSGGRTILDPGDLDLNVPARRWGFLGVPSSDPTHGRSLDIVVVQDTVAAAAGEVLGYSGGIKLRSQGGIIEGAGPNHALVLSLFDSSGQPHPVASLLKTLAHELGHFLSLLHTTETGFQPNGGGDDCYDTPVSTTANDTDGDRRLGPGDSLQACPDFMNLMFPLESSAAPQTTLTAHQAAAVRAYLAIRRH